MIHHAITQIAETFSCEYIVTITAWSPTAHPLERMELPNRHCTYHPNVLLFYQ